MPGSCQRPRLRLAVSNHHRNNEVGIIECSSIRVRDGVSQFAALVNRTRCLWCAMRTYSPRKGELPEEFEHARFVAAFVGINFGIVPFEVAVGKGGRRAMTRARNIDDVQIVFLDKAIQVYPNQRLAWIGAPVTEQPVLDVFRPERFS